MKKFYKIVASFLTAVIVFTCAAFVLKPEVVNAYYYYSNPITGSHNYEYSQWAKVPNGYLTKLSTGYMFVSGNNNSITASYYNDNYQFLSQTKISLTYELWGGFYSDGSYYYIITGNKNYEESATKECYILTKFDTNWNQLGRCAISNCNTVEPFAAGSISFVSNGDLLYVLTTHKMYKAGDGYNHQSCYSLIFNTKTMTEVDNSLAPYSSHSFNQFILNDNGDLVTLNHGDAYPRAVMINRFTGDDLWTKGYVGRTTSEVFKFLYFPGATGRNYTGCSIGGFEASETSYLTVGSMINMDNYDTDKVQNAFIAVTDKNTGDTSITMLTDCSNSVRNPFLVKVHDDCFAIIWSEIQYDENYDAEETVKYTYVNGKGEQTEKVYSMTGSVSSVQPIVVGKNIVWVTHDDYDYSTEGVHDGRLTFYSIIADPVAAKAQIGGFVDRLYLTCMNRDSDPTGKNYWVEGLFDGTYTGVGAASGFVFSPEFKGMNLCNSDYIERLYAAFMGRASDETGKAYWISQLQSGVTREEVFNGFAMSPEFRGICSDYGIVLGSTIGIPAYGTVPTGNCSVCNEADGITEFVTRLYDVCLDRSPDPSGLDHWRNQLISHAKSGRDIADGFIFSPEFEGRDFSDEEFVEYMYKAFFGRASDPDGKAYWLGRLANGSTRRDVFDGFVGSPEFNTICNTYGITRG